MLLKEKRVGLRHIITVVIIGLLLLWFVPLAFGQHAIREDVIADSAIQKLETSPVFEPVFSNYRGIAIGTTEAELLVRIDTKPRFESKDDYFYVISDAETAQFLLDEERKVKMISITYFGNDYSSFPTHEDVFGKNVAAEMMAHGKVSNLVNYPDYGFWVGYYRSSGETPLVIITIQKL